MTGKQHFHTIINQKSEKCGFWHGDAWGEALVGLGKYFGVNTNHELGKKLNDTVIWLPAGTWNHPEGLPMLDPFGGKPKLSHAQPGIFADATSVAQIEKHDWSDPKYLDFEPALKEIEEHGKDEIAILSGTWSPFFHQVADYFGMENYFCMMHTDPDIVEAVTEHIVDFCLQANERFFKLAGDKIDAFFFGNDFGTQLDMFISVEDFNRFVLPYFTRLVQQAKSFGLKVVLHSCGSIWRIIPQLIDIGVDVLHPIQAKAKNMDAEYLAKNFNGKIVFMGGVDTQDILPFHTPQEVKDEVRRLKGILGPNYIISPSHECILPIVPPENIEAMAQAAMEE